MAVTLQQNVVRCGIFACLALLAACGTAAHDPIWRSVQSLTARLGPQVETSPPISEQKAAMRAAVAQSAQDAPRLLLYLPRRKALATMARLSDAAGVETWADVEGRTIALRGDIVIETRGLGADLMASDVTGLRAAMAGTGPPRYVRRSRVLDPTGVLVWRSDTCVLSTEGQVHTERCHGAARYENRYAPGISRQWLGPELGYLEMERLR